MRLKTKTMKLSGCLAAGAIGAAVLLAGAPDKSGLAAETASKQQSKVRYFRGNAVDLKTGKFLYSENHAEYRRGEQHTHSIVTYRDAQGKAFARKRITFTRNATQPDFRLEDFRDGYVEGAKLLGGTRFQFFKRSERGAELEQEVVSISAPGVIDGGFDYYVRNNFAALSRGEARSVNFGVSARFTYFTFVISKVRNGQRAGRPTVQFKLAPQNFVLRQLIDPLFVTYDAENKRLLEYRGYTNIDDGTSSGTNFEARIVFNYPDKK